ncbi:MAG: hypothetical protein SVP26_06790 [Chloroflexota bacterium]|nr:hypothetical protein [Chloroflexota bacterium]
MKLGDRVRIKECDPIPEVVGETAEIVDLQMQPFEVYREYPVWARVVTGERAGKVYGFQENEVDILPLVSEAQIATREAEVKAGTSKVLQQLEQVLASVTTAEELDDAERLIADAKGKVLAEPGMGFWEGKTPCWEMFRCPEAVRKECPAFKYRTRPCWEIEGTYCKLYDYGAKGDGTEICEHCRVYKRFGQDQPIQIKLFGKGFNPAGT